MEYDERLALFRQTRLNPFDRGEDEEDGPQGGKTPPQHGEDPHDPNTGYELCSSVVTFLMHSWEGGTPRNEIKTCVSAAIKLVKTRK